MPRIGRDQILETLSTALEEAPFTVCLWESGAAAFDRVDEWSDIDLMCAVEDDAMESTFEVVENALISLSAISDRYRVPEPAWHGFKQCYYRLQDASPHHVVDFVVLPKSSERRTDPGAKHGTPRICFDKAGWLEATPLDEAAHAELIAGRLTDIEARFRMFADIPAKELRRGRAVDAVAFYMGLLLRPLVELLRIRHDPVRFGFGPRYLDGCLPGDDYARLERLYYVAEPAALGAAIEEACQWTAELLAAHAASRDRAGA